MKSLIAAALLTLATAHAGETTLHVMTYNVHGMIFIDNDHSRYHEIARVLKELRAQGKAPAIVAIQEAFHERTKELVRDSGYPHHVWGPDWGYWPLKMKSGLLILSEYPLHAKRTHVFEACSGVDCFARKAVIGVEANVPGVPFPIEILDTHTNATYDRDKPHGTVPFVRARKRQFDELASYFASQGTRTPVKLFLGDFNVRQSEFDDYKAMLNTLKMPDAGETCARDSRCAFLDPDHERWRKPVDHVLYTTGWAASSVTLEPMSWTTAMTQKYHGEPLSDHLAIEMTFKLSWRDDQTAL